MYVCLVHDFVRMHVCICILFVSVSLCVHICRSVQVRGRTICRRFSPTSWVLGLKPCLSILEAILLCWTISHILLALPHLLSNRHLYIFTCANILFSTDMLAGHRLCLGSLAPVDDSIRWLELSAFCHSVHGEHPSPFISAYGCRYF